VIHRKVEGWVVAEREISECIRFPQPRLWPITRTGPGTRISAAVSCKGSEQQRRTDFPERLECWPGWPAAGEAVVSRRDPRAGTLNMSIFEPPERCCVQPEKRRASLRRFTYTDLRGEVTMPPTNRMALTALLAVLQRCSGILLAFLFTYRFYASNPCLRRTCSRIGHSRGLIAASSRANPYP
jgi:hypothetical protein